MTARRQCAHWQVGKPLQAITTMAAKNVQAVRSSEARAEERTLQNAIHPKTKVDVHDIGGGRELLKPAHYNEPLPRQKAIDDVVDISLLT